MNKTIDYYNENAENFKIDTINVSFDDRQNMLLKYLNEGDRILDLGCGAGRDSKAFLEKGYNTISIDGSKELCKIATDYIGKKVDCVRFENINYKEKFEGIWACASLLHIEKNSLLDILEKAIDGLKINGYFYMSFKYGDFEGMRNGRYFTDFKEDTFKEFIKNINRVEIVEIEITSDARPSRENEKWLNLILKKIRK